MNINFYNVNGTRLDSVPGVPGRPRLEESTGEKGFSYLSLCWKIFCHTATIFWVLAPGPFTYLCDIRTYVGAADARIWSIAVTKVFSKWHAVNLTAE